MMILEVDEALVFEDLSLDIQSAIKSVNAKWPESVLIGTQPVDGKQLILVVVDSSKTELEQLIDSFGLSWRVLAVEGVQIDQSELLKYWLPQQSTDIETGLISYESVTDLTGKIQVIAGHSWSY